MSDTIDRWFPPQSRRVIVAVADYLKAGEHPDKIAAELSLPVGAVNAVLAATVKLTMPPLPGLGVRRIMAYNKQVGIAVNGSDEDRPWQGSWTAHLWPVVGVHGSDGEPIIRPRLKDLRAALLERLEEKGMWWEWQ